MHKHPDSNIVPYAEHRTIYVVVYTLEYVRQGFDARQKTSGGMDRKVLKWSGNVDGTCEVWMTKKIVRLGCGG